MEIYWASFTNVAEEYMISLFIACCSQSVASIQCGKMREKLFGCYGQHNNQNLCKNAILTICKRALYNSPPHLQTTKAFFLSVTRQSSLHCRSAMLCTAETVPIQLHCIVEKTEESGSIKLEFQLLLKIVNGRGTFLEGRRHRIFLLKDLGVPVHPGASQYTWQA